jgi:hypothetical protein
MLSFLKLNCGLRSVPRKDCSAARESQQGTLDALYLASEFMETLVLVLLGDGLCAGVTLRESYAADAGWMVITTGRTHRVLCGVMVAQAFGSPALT